MHNMSSSRAAMIILAVLCCSSEFYSTDPVVSFENDNLPRKKWIVGKHHINGSTLVYALCDADNKQTPQCTVKFRSDVYNHSKSNYSCNLDLRRELPNGKIDYLEVNPWGKDRAILMWREMDKNDIRYSHVRIITVYLEHCNSTEFRFKIRNRDDMITQIFILPSVRTYDVAFMDTERCGSYFCKITVNGNRQVGRVVCWFPITGLVRVLKNIEHHSNKLLITIGEINRDMGIAEVYLLKEKKGASAKKLLGTYSNIENLGFFTANGIVSLCNYVFCTQYSYKGKSKKVTDLHLPNNPVKFRDLYSLPHNEHFAMVCDARQDHYRIIIIDADGKLQYAFDLKQLECKRKYEILTTNFFRQSNGEYCLSLYFTRKIVENNSKFDGYCFSFQNFVTDKFKIIQN